MNNRMIYLQYLSCEKQFSPSLPYRPFEPDDYYIVSMVPRGETLDIVDTAEWFIKRSAEAEWLRSKVRVIRAGDVLQDDKVVYMFVPAEEGFEGIFPLNDTDTVIRLANLALVKLELTPEDEGRLYDGG